jgi:hypothetical protein
MNKHRDNLTNHEGLLCYKEDGVEYALGYLFNMDGTTFCPMTGRWTGISFEEKDAHNKVLSEGELKGLDENCEVGQYGTFYLTHNPSRVTTFTGTVVSTDVFINGQSITFSRKGKTFRGRLQKDADCFNFRRIS